MKRLRHLCHGTVRAAALAIALGLGAGALAAQPAIVKDPIPEQPVAQALSALSTQTGLQIVYMSRVADGLRSTAIPGGLSSDEALRRLLASSGLSFEFLNDRTVTITSAADARRPADKERVKPIAAETSGALVPVHGAAAQQEAEAASRTQGAQGGGAEESDGAGEIAVTGSRIRSALGEQTTQPVITLTEKDIARYGVSSVGELFRNIPQISSSSIGQIVSPASVGATTPLQAQTTDARVSATLRGSPNAGTLILIDGRRAPKNGQVSGQDGYDASGIPLAAIERIDILLDGASAIYGADAVGGVINIILKKQYRGTEVRMGYDNTFDSDAAASTVSITSGFSAGRFRGLVTLAGEEGNALMWRDRWFLSTYDRRAFGGSDNRGTNSGRGTVRRSSGNLPGLATNSALIPAGSTGVGLTVADYQNSGLVPDVPVNLASYAQYMTPYSRRSALANAAYQFSEHLNVFTQARWGKSSTTSSGTPFSTTNSTVPAGAPGNPFGIPIIVSKTFYDVPSTYMRTATTTNIFGLVGVEGALARGWRYESTVSQNRSKPDMEANHGAVLNAALLAAAFGSNPASGPNLLYDSTGGISPNPPGTLEAFFPPPVGAERTRAATYDAKLDGPLWQLPAGAVQVALGAEYRKEYADFPLQSAATTFARDRDTSGFFVEARVPLVSDRQHWRGVDRLELTLSARHDRYADFPESTSPRYGLLYRPVRWLMVRGSYGKGYKVPTLSQLYSGHTEGLGIFTSLLDPFRGNQPVPLLIPTDFSGNPDLLPERSTNVTAGLWVEMPGIDGLTLSLDYFDTEYTDRVGGVPLADRMILFPETVTRGANLPGDQPGWLGPIERYADLSANIASERIKGYDIGVNLERPTRLGEVSLRTSINYTLDREVHAIPGQPATSQSTRDSLPLQVKSALFLARGAFEVGLLTSYRDHARGNNLPTTLYTPSAIRWDVQGSFDVPYLTAARVGVTIFNVFDAIPPMDPSGYPTNLVVDSRLRRYAVSFTKSF